MKLPKITTKQQDIIELLYRYRFLNRIQIQQLMGHKDKRRVLSWLKDLRDKDYIEWIYSRDFSEKSKPAIYYIGINGVRYLKTVQWNDNGTLAPFYPLDEVRKRYKENERSRTFIDRSMLIADCCMMLEQANTDKIKPRYTYITEADYIDPDSNYNFLSEHETLRSNLCIVKKLDSKENAEAVTTNYLLEIFDATLPRYRLRHCLKAYVTYLDDNEWEGEEPQPIILLVCPNLNDLIYVKLPFSATPCLNYLLS
ncbi:MAG TPA: replication-relaxation family protein [Candidatus Saccharimonadales bacterium]|nr:replication-relaxation family protein [Candidatus Saccharimonadales bacterium]